MRRVKSTSEPIYIRGLTTSTPSDWSEHETLGSSGIKRQDENELMKELDVLEALESDAVSIIVLKQCTEILDKVLHISRN